ncbi:hypothetical protein FPJ27_08730 [Burkholderia sp. MS455]|uniref:hypothetical protein n=1 Tax=Burkholderia sp. MS455 TaxID=2811788 RepID=UPI00195985FE|nr:hypothetical protein [Burkholderia sp. MS455]QRR06488.1 hypothetical protein FPJ27_08730 [Burkholderia sp. MS455]
MSAFMPVISATQFIELVNQRLPSHHVFKAGMRVFLVRPASADADATEFDYRDDEYFFLKSRVAFPGISR